MSAKEGDYRLVVETRPTHVRATVTGARTPENAQRFLQEAFAACVGAGRDTLLLEMNLEGPPLDAAAIFRVIAGGAPAGAKLRRIAYVDAFAGRRTGPAFATTVAANRGVNVRLFADLASAEAWLRSEG